MKHLNELLIAHPSKPKRKLSANFAQTIVAQINKPERVGIWQKFNGLFHLPVLGKAGALALVALIMVSGTVAAVTLWPQPSISPASTQELPNGNRIVGYDAQNCSYITHSNEDTATSSHKLYYEVRQGSSVTDSQLQNALRAMCEDAISNEAIRDIQKQLPGDNYGEMSTAVYVITGITNDSITVSLDPHYDTATLTLRPNMTYTNLASNVQLYNRDRKASYSDFHIGNSIKMLVRDSSGKSTETPEGYSPLNHPEHITILAMVKMPALTGDPYLFDRAVVTDLVRVTPCTDSPTGFCRAYDFSN